MGGDCYTGGVYDAEDLVAGGICDACCSPEVSLMESEDPVQMPCTRCMSFFKGLIHALLLSGIAWGLIIFIVYYLVK